MMRPPTVSKPTRLLPQIFEWDWHIVTHHLGWHPPTTWCSFSGLGLMCMNVLMDVPRPDFKYSRKCECFGNDPIAVHVCSTGRRRILRLSPCLPLARHLCTSLKLGTTYQTHPKTQKKNTRSLKAWFFKVTELHILV